MSYNSAILEHPCSELQSNGCMYHWHVTCIHRCCSWFPLTFTIQLLSPGFKSSDSSHLIGLSSSPLWKWKRKKEHEDNYEKPKKEDNYEKPKKEDNYVKAKKEVNYVKAKKEDNYIEWKQENGWWQIKWKEIKLKNRSKHFNIYKKRCNLRIWECESVYEVM